MKVDKAKGRLRGKQPKLIGRPGGALELWRAGKHASAELFSTSPLHRLPRRAARWGTEDCSDPQCVNEHVFIDETKRRGYLLVARAIVPG